MESSNTLNCPVRVKEEPVEVSLTENDYNIIDKTPDIFQFFRSPQEKPLHKLQKSDENGELNDLEIQFESKDVKLNVDLLAVMKIENWPQNYLEGMDDRNGYQAENIIKVETAGAVKLESFANGATFNDQHRLKTHIETTRSGSDKECKICSEKFSKKSSLKSHIDSVHNKNTHACDLCQKKFIYKSQLRTHIDLVHNGVTYTCGTCGKIFLYKRSLKVHHETLHKCITHTCDTCGKSFTQKGNLKRHIESSHMGIRHTCDLCKKTFNYKSHLKRHVRSTHMGIRHTCDLCQKKFTNKDYLKYHIKGGICTRVSNTCAIHAESHFHKKDISKLTTRCIKI
uniref:C2H2-type domain-containing protein n=1 Tax=Trichogramma kaykai TaxID=54128 RepID=A0ABD2XGW1_9HYME